MSSTTDYTELLPEITEITAEKLLVPNLPMSVVVQEAEDLYHWCKDDQQALTKAGLNWDLAVSLPTRAGACREAQSLWVKEHNIRQESEQLWKDEAPAAFGLRDFLIHTFRYAFRNDAGLSGRVDEIAQGDTNADMVQDLNDLAVLGKAHTEELTVVGFDLPLLDLAADLSDRMGNLLGETNGDRDEDSKTLLIRDQAYTYLKLAMDEIRQCGKFVFWRTPERLKGYNSHYWKQQKKSEPEKATTLA